MKLKLKNFRCYEDYELELPDTGLVLLSGESGSGKSTILNAILHALWGKVRKPYTFGTTSCVVNFDFKGISLKRSNKPNVFTLNFNKLNLSDSATRPRFIESLSDSPAQEWLNAHLGMDLEEFMISSYIPQKNNTSILSLPPTEQLRLIQVLAYSQGAIKEKINVQIKVDLESLNKTKTQLEFSEKELKSLDIPKKVELPFEEEHIPDFQSRLLKLPKKINKLNGQISELNSQITNAESNLRELKLLKERKKEVGETLNNLKIKKESLNSQIGETVTKSEIEELKNQITILELKEQYTQLLQEHLLSVEKTKKEIGEKLKKFKVVELESKLIELKKEYEFSTLFEDVCKQLNCKFETLSELIDHIDSIISSEIKTCPKCKTNIKIENDVLITTELTPTMPNSKKATKKELEICKKYRPLLNSNPELRSIKTIEFDLKETESQLKEYTKLKNKFDELDSPELPPTLKNMKNKIGSLNLTSTNLNELKEKLELLTVNYSRYSENASELKKVEIELFNTTNKSDKLKINIEKLKSELEEFDIEVLKESLEDLKEKLSEINEIHIQDLKNQKIVTDYLKYTELNSQVEKWQSKVDKYSTKYKFYNLEYTGTLRIKEKYRQAEILALDSTIDSINEHTQYWLDLFFTEPMKARLIITQNENNKNEIKTIINYKGFEYDSPSQLSGGEFDRCTLASICGINSMLNSPFLILDESLSSLDSENNTAIIDCLKELAKTKLVLVCSHEAVRGVFDTVVEL